MTEQKRYLLWYRKKHFGKEITGCMPIVYDNLSELLNTGEEQRERGEWIDYNYSIVNCPVLMGKDAHNVRADT